MSCEESGCSACSETSRRLDRLEAELTATSARLESVRREAFEREQRSVGILWRAVSALRIDLERMRAGRGVRAEADGSRD